MAAKKGGEKRHGRGARHVKCGRKCNRNAGRSWPLMPDRISVAAAWAWFNNRYSN